MVWQTTRKNPESDSVAETAAGLKSQVKLEGGTDNIDRERVRKPAAGSGGHKHTSDCTHFICDANFSPKKFQLNSLQGELSPPDKREPRKIAEQFIVENADELNLTKADFANSTLKNSHTGRNGISHFYYRQMHNGLEIRNADLNININKDGQVINVNSTFVKNVAQVHGVSIKEELRISREKALEGLAEFMDWPSPELIAVNAQGDIDAPNISHKSIPTSHEYVVTDDGIELAWNLNVHTADKMHCYDTSVSAKTGEVLFMADWVSCAGYEVFDLPLENPEDGTRTVSTDPNDLTASPFGWHDTDGIEGAEYTITRGNNVYAREDRDNNNSGGYSPDGGSSLSFIFPLDLTQHPYSNEDAVITNLFYWNNLIHDIMHYYGFDEASGNFQTTNYSGAGLGGDAVVADAQDGSGTNNANMLTPPDGQAPRMQMYIWTQSDPERDSSLDNGVIIHEYGHGITNRLTGGASNASALSGRQSRGMGEGWSDWYALMFTQVPTDGQMDSYPIGSYSYNSPGGIRSFPYSYDMNVNPLTYIEYEARAFSVHSTGEIWCATLWDLNWKLINKHGYDVDLYTGAGGNNIALALVTEGLKLQPSEPTFLDARDAILLADQHLYGGANQDEIWEVFARRGMGFSADDGGDHNATDITEAFDLPGPIIAVQNLTIDDSLGNGDGIFNPGESLTVTYNLVNHGPKPSTDLTLAISVEDPLISLSSHTTDYGTMDPGASSETDSFQIMVDPSHATGVSFDLVFDLSDGFPRTYQSIEVISIYETTTLSGTVSDISSGSPLSGATIHYAGVISGTVATNSAGEYSVVLPGGDYEIYATASGYSTSAISPVALSGNTTLDFVMGIGGFTISPPELTRTLALNTTQSVSFEAFNPGTGITEYVVNNIPTFAENIDVSNKFTDISSTGEVLSISNRVDGYTEVNLSNFTFEFYGVSYPSIYVSSNGLISFGQPNASYINNELPNSFYPPLIAAFWDDLNPRNRGNVYFQEFSDHAIVQYDDVARYGDSATSLTFQVILRSNGSFIINYANMSGTLDSATIGYQDGGSRGKMYAYNENYVQSNFKIANINWCKLTSPNQGVLNPSDTENINFFLDASDMIPGSYNCDYLITHNAPGVDPVTITININITNKPPEANAGADQKVSIVTSEPPPATVGADVFLSAALDDGGNTTWEDSLAEWSPTLDEGVMYVADAGSDLPGITSAYSFPGGSGGSGGAAGSSFHGVWHSEPVSMEIWFKPDSTGDDGVENGQILFETGGRMGLGIFYNDGAVEVGHDTTEVISSHDVSSMAGDFIQVVLTYDESDFVLYVNGVMAATGSRSDNNWSGSDEAGLAARGGKNTGGRGDGDSNTESFEGKIAIFRAYRDQILTVSEVLANYRSIAGASFATVGLAGVASDPDGNTPTAHWSVIDGPGPVAFDDASALDATAVFMTAGTYTLRLTVDDGVETAIDDVIIEVQGPSGSFSDWIAAYGIDEALTGLSDDPDGDRVSNALENYFGTDPSTFTRGVLPGKMDSTNNTFTFSHPINSNHATDLVARYRWATNLEANTFHLADGSSPVDSSTTVNCVPAAPVDGRVTVTATISDPAPKQIFFDIEVTQQP